MALEHTETHGHEVLEMMVQCGQPYSKESQKAAIDDKFGSDARFCICSGGGMTAKELIEALWEKDKFSGTPDSFVFKAGNRCDH